MLARVEFDRAQPGLQDLLAPAGKIRRQGGQFGFHLI